jgi:inner membrane protein involved in colicin E2 resistance
VRTNFHNVDFPDDAISPMDIQESDEGLALTWRAANLLTTQAIGVTMPEKINPGPLSGRITFFAPVCLLFFFLLVATIGIIRRVSIHPMHYLFVTGGFFAFHLLFAYLVDHIDVHVAFGIAAVASVTLVTAYLRAALGKRFPWRIGAAGQGFYLVLFSYSFFLRGTTGLTVTLGAVATLAMLMWVTARIDWTAVFARPPKPEVAPHASR